VRPASRPQVRLRSEFQRRKFAYVANSNGNNVSAYTIDAANVSTKISRAMHV